MVTGPSGPMTADELFAAQQYAEAEAAYRNLIAQQPANGMTHKGLGLALLMQGKVDEGVAECGKAAALLTTDTECRYAYAFALGQAGRYEEAIPELDAALALHPSHVPSRQALLYCLLQSGRKHADLDHVKADTFFERAHKLDSQNAEITAEYLVFLFKTRKLGKLVKYVGELTDDQKNNRYIKPVLDRVHADSEADLHLKQAAMTKKPIGLVPNAPKQKSIQEVPCPQCGRPMMNYAAICPHCNFQVRAYGSFAGRDTGPAYSWQEVAYTILSIRWCLDAVRMIIMAFALNIVGFSAFLGYIGCANLAIGLGLVFKQEWIAFIAKIMCYGNVLFNGLAAMQAAMLGHWGLAALPFFTMCMAGFFIYLISFVVDS